MSDPRVYVGYPDPWTVFVRGADGRERPLEHHVRHSPDGFAWGYGGSGPAELARCILIDYFGDAARCSACSGMGKEGGFSSAVCPQCGGEGFVLPTPTSYQAFKWDWIAKFPPDEGFELSADDIAEWLQTGV